MADNDNKLISLRDLEEFRKLSQWTLSKNGETVTLTGPKGETSSIDVGDVDPDLISDITDRIEVLENSSITSDDINGLTPAFTESSTLTNISSGDSISTLFGKIKKAITDLISHITNYANPHLVTKSQVGLGNVDNTSDADKPISTATQGALDGKVSKLKPETLVYDLTAPNFIGHLTGAADRLTNARTISLSGDASGSATFDGSQNVDITTTVVNATGATAGKMFLYQGIGQNTNGTITQKLFTDLTTAVDDVQKSADGKNTIYYKTTAPVASEDVVLKENDLWFDTDDGNKPYRWNGTAWVEAPFGDAAIANLDAGKITAGYISASRIAANTIASAHIATGAVNADKIEAGAVTADKISINDLSALNATIGGFSISNSAIYSANKTSFSDSDSGVYFGSNGTINIGDSSQYIKFSNDGLQIRADSLSVSGSSVATTADLDDAVKTVVVEYVSSDSPVTPPTTGWSATNPNWEEGKYVWQRTITTYINDTSVISDPICIQGARGMGVVSQVPHYLASDKSEGVTSADSGWSKTVPTLTNEKKYLWMYYTNMLSSQTEPETVTATGNPVEFESRGNNPITGSIHLVPIQNNSYDYAWAGGEGKNLIDDSKRVMNSSNTTITLGQTVGFGTTTISLKAGTYTFSVVFKDGVSAHGYMKSTYSELSSKRIWQIGDNHATFTLAEDADCSFYVYNSNGLTVNDVISAQLEIGSEVTDYEPYSNICPISNYNSVTVTRAGENILDGITFESGYYTDTGEPHTSSITQRTAQYIPCTGGKSYAVLFTYKDSATEARVRVHEYNENQQWLRQVYISTDAIPISTSLNVVTWTASSDASSFRFSLAKDADTIECRGNAIVDTIALSSGIYCSDVTLDYSGAMTFSNHGEMATFDGTANVTTSSVSEVFKLPLSHVPVAVGFSDDPFDLYCDKLKPVSRYELHNGAHGIAYDGEGSYLQIRAGNATTVAEVKTWLTSNPITVVYRKAVSETSALPSMDISTFVGNNIFYSPDHIESNITISYTDCETMTTDAYISGVYGDKGEDGVTPVISATKDNGVTVITSNGISIAQINDGEDGNTPIITATKSNGVTVIKSDNLPIAEINDGERGTGTIKISTAPTAYTTTTGGFTPAYRVSISAILDAGVSEVKIGDILENSYYHYPVGYIDVNYVYLGARVSIRGATGSRGATWYAGTAITGTSTTAAIFSGSGISSAIVSDHYLNTDTQNVYVCMKAGNATTATWAFEQNIKGENGIPGTNGTDGKTAYFHVKYSNDGGATFTANSGETAGSYIGTYTDNTEADSTSVSAYTWVKIEGEDGVSPTLTTSKTNGVTTITITDASGTKTATVNDGAAGARGATWYAGTAITGTSTTAAVFSGSGITSAIVGDHYLNTSTQNVYVCKKAGNASTATWAYEQNIKGATGTPGTNGTNGKTAYFHVKYSNDGGATFTANSGETAGSYIGTYTDNTAADSTSVSAYTWVKIEGEDGVSPTLTTSKTNGVTTITITDASGTKTATVNDGTAGARGATWYAGTAITGTSTTAAVFSGSGIASAIVGDHYLNTSTQNVYVCKKAGNASTATWAYEQNIKGAQGTPGTNGTNGKTAYFHVKYSNDGGATFTANSGETAGSYIGTYTDNTEADSTSVSAYTWVKIEGEDGERGATWYAGTTITGTDTTAKVFSGSGITAAIVGDHYLNTSTQNVYVCKKAGNASTATWAYEQNIKGAQGTPGTNGTNGQTAYFHVKYSDDGGTTFTGNSGEDAGAYIGTYTDNTAADSTSVSAYTWVKIEGTDGKNGTNAIGLAWKINYSSFTKSDAGECYFYGYNSDNEEADVDGWVMWNGEKLTVTKGMWINHNGKIATYTPILHVYRTNVEPCHADVWWDKNLKKWRGCMYTTGKVPDTVGDWTWDETNDAILATYLLNGTAAEASISSAQLFNPPKKYSELPDYENLVAVEDLGINLAPYFARSPYTLDNSYWDNLSLNESYQLEDIGEGWMHVTCTNTTSSTIRYDYAPIASNEIKPDTDYTFLVEVRNNHSTGNTSGTDIYLVQRNDCQFWGANIKENIEGDNTNSNIYPITNIPLDSPEVYRKRFVKTSEATDSTHWTSEKPTGLACFTTRCAKNTTIDYEIRISVYEGRYTGPFRPYVDASVRNLADDANSKIDNLQVGGRNLLLGSNDTSKWGRYTPEQYQIANINTSIALVAGQEYTLTIWGTQPTRSDKTETNYSAYYSGGSILLGEISIDDDKGYGSLTFTMPTYSTTNHYLALFNTPMTGDSNTTYSCSIERIKLEVGNHGTDWTAAPEDFESGIATAQTTATNAQTAAGNAQTTADTAKDLAESVQPELIVGTHGTSATATWTGTSSVLKEIKAGTRIQYKLSSAGKSNVTLNLTLVGGTTTGAKEVYYNNTTRLGTQYGVNAVIDLVYDGSYWRILNPYTNSNNYDRILYSQAVKAATAYVGTHILCGTSAGYSNIGANVQFELSYPLLWYATAATTTIDAGATANNHYLTYPNINFSVNGTIQSGGAYKQLYLKGTMTGGKFKIAASNYLTTVEPTSADGLYYIPLGVMSSATNGRFVSTDKLYAYLNGAFQCVEYASKELADEAAKTATNFMYFDDTNGLVISQEGEINTSHPITALQEGNVRIDSDSVDIYNGQDKIASYGDNIILGDAAKNHMELDYHSLQLFDRWKKTYLHVSDLRDQTGYATLTERIEPLFSGSSMFPIQLSHKASNIISVSICSISDKSEKTDVEGYTPHDSWQPVAKGNTVRNFYPTWIEIPSTYSVTDDNYFVVVYRTNGDLSAFTFGSRNGDDGVGAGSVVMGTSSSASGTNSVAIGSNALSTGKTSVSIGDESVSYGKNSIALGENVSAAYDNQVVVGYWNKAEDGAFLVGNGDSDNRNTAFKVSRHGDVISDGRVFSYYKNEDAGAWGVDGDPWYIKSGYDPGGTNLWGASGAPVYGYTSDPSWPSGLKKEIMLFDSTMYNPTDGIIGAETLNVNPNNPGLYGQTYWLARGGIYELYTYEYNTERTAAPYNYRGSHAYLITVPAATNYTKVNMKPNIITMASSANSGVNVTANYGNVNDDGCTVTIGVNATAYRVKYCLKRCSYWKTDQIFDAVERAFWMQAHPSS